MNINLHNINLYKYCVTLQIGEFHFMDSCEGDVIGKINIGGISYIQMYSLENLNENDSVFILDARIYSIEKEEIIRKFDAFRLFRPVHLQSSTLYEMDLHGGEFECIIVGSEISFSDEFAVFARIL